MKVTVDLPKLEIQHMIERAVLSAIRGNLKKTVTTLLENRMRREVFEGDLKIMIKEGVIAYLEKFKIRDLIKDIKMKDLR